MMMNGKKSEYVLPLSLHPFSPPSALLIRFYRTL